jgi:hypothetical protein
LTSDENTSKKTRSLLQKKTFLPVLPDTNNEWKLPASRKLSAQRKQDSKGNKITTKANYSASVEAKHKARKKLLSIKKDCKCFQNLEIFVDTFY